MTRTDHAIRLRPHLRGAARARPGREVEIVVNVQGDLPTIEPADHPRGAAPLEDAAVDIATLGVEIVRDEEKTNPNVVKIVGSPLGGEPAARALFHARHRALRARGRSIITSASMPIAAPRSSASSSLAPSPLERREKLEQLRALEAGMRIDVEIVRSVPLGVDTPDDLERARDNAFNDEA